MSQPHVAILDDEAEIRRILADALNEAGFRTSTYSRATEFEAALKRTAPDVCLVDLGLPDRDGLALVHRLALESGATIIIISGRANTADRVTGLELGADDYLAKPFSMLELVARVRALLRRIEQMRSAPAAAVAELRFGSFRLDTVRRELLHGTQLVPLTLREFDLLHFLLRHPGRAFQRGELLQRVWGAAFDGYEHTVNSHINRLRTKIEDDPRDPRRIVTVWGVGYRFEEPAA